MKAKIFFLLFLIILLVYYSNAQNFSHEFGTVTDDELTLRTYEKDTTAEAIIIYDIAGRKIKEWNLYNQPSGLHNIIWDSTNLTGQKVSTGLYLYQMQTGNFVETKKMVFMK